MTSWPVPLDRGRQLSLPEHRTSIVMCVLRVFCADSCRSRGLVSEVRAGLLVPGVTMKTQGEIEAAIGQTMNRFEQDYMGRGPKDIHAHLIGNLLIVRLMGVLTAAEQQLVKTLPVEKGRDLVKQVRTQLIETARPLLEPIVQEVTGTKVISMHHDISTRTGEELVAFTLDAPPECREAKRK
jgi:uncharacterized protein YbcI